jgi:type 1 glutamine amidotransferase
MRLLSLLLMFAVAAPAAWSEDAQWLEFKGQSDRPGSGKRVVLVSGDEEYRSEELLPQLAKMLSKHHGMDCVVLFALDPETGEINPDRSDNIPGLHQLGDADLMIIATRFRALPDEQMKHLVEYIESGKPIIGLRTATHAFNNPGSSAYARYGWQYKGEDYEGGFGRQVLGETWIAHHGKHNVESTRGLVADADHPIATGIADGDIWGPSDVYRVRLPLPGDSHVIFRGAILSGMKPADEIVADDRNDPMMPIGWTRSYRGGRVFATTMGAATDFLSEGVRRMIVNATFWALELEDAIDPELDVSTVGEFKPTAFGFGGYVKGKRPADYQ